MKILALLSLCITVLTTLSLVIGLITNSKQYIEPKKKASVGLFMAFSMCLYIIFMSATGLFGIIKHYYLSLFLLLFAVIPFIIGYFSSFNKIKLYTIYQIVSHITCLLILTWIYLAL